MARVRYVKLIVKISPIFVAFLENVNFKESHFNYSAIY